MMLLAAVGNTIVDEGVPSAYGDRSWQPRTVRSLYGGGMEIPKAWGPTLGWTDVGRMIQAQNRMLEQLPDTLIRLTELLDALVPAVADAAASMSAAARVTVQVEALVQEVDGPIRRLLPAIERLALALDDPAVDAVPDTLERIHRVVHPISNAVDRGAIRLAAVRARVHRASARVTAPRTRPQSAER